MKTIKFLLLIITLSIGTMSFAQSHNTTTGSACKYAKNRCTNMEGCPQCAACTLEDKKEKDAKVAEVKKRNDKIWADAKAKKDAEQKAYQAKLVADNAEAKRKADAGKVLINASKTLLTENNTKSNNKETKGDRNYRYMSAAGDWQFRDENGYIQGSNPNFKVPLRVYGTFKIEGKSIARYLHPAETGVVLNSLDNKYCNGQNPAIYDIVDYNLNTLFNDDSIHYIEHFYENWFLIGYLSCDNYEKEYSSIKLMSLKFYNVKSKKFSDIKIDNPFVKLSLTTIKGNNNEGDLVFHNEFYLTGEYNNQRDNRTVKHSSYELLLDKLSGGNNIWKAGTCIKINRSSNKEDYHYVVYIIDKDSNFKSFSVDKINFSKYYALSEE